MNIALTDDVSIDTEAPVGQEFLSSPYWQYLVEYPYQADLFALLRWVDAQRKKGPLLGRGARPQFDPIRLGQEPFLNFAASTIARVDTGHENRVPKLIINSFGLFGPNGALPLHLTEYARERIRLHSDATLVKFLDIFHHRLTLLFYRAWADAHPTVSMDRVDNDRFTDHIASLTGFGQPSMRNRDTVSDHAKFFQSGHLVRQTRNPEGLAKILADYLQIPVAIEEFMPHWITLPEQQQTRLLSSTNGNNRLNIDAMLGERIFDVQHKIRLLFGPMPYSRYCALLPGSEALKQTIAWVRNYIGLEYYVDIKLALCKDEVPQAQLGGIDRLGWSTWLGERPTQRGDADDLIINCDLKRQRPKRSLS